MFSELAVKQTVRASGVFECLWRRWIGQNFVVFLFYTLFCLCSHHKSEQTSWSFKLNLVSETLQGQITSELKKKCSSLGQRHFLLVSTSSLLTPTLLLELPLLCVCVNHYLRCSQHNGTSWASGLCDAGEHCCQNTELKEKQSGGGWGGEKEQRGSHSKKSAMKTRPSPVSTNSRCADKLCSNSHDCILSCSQEPKVSKDIKYVRLNYGNIIGKQIEHPDLHAGWGWKLARTCWFDSWNHSAETCLLSWWLLAG